MCVLQPPKSLCDQQGDLCEDCVSTRWASDGWVFNISVINTVQMFLPLDWLKPYAF